jgi:hypothetical protein
VSNLVPTTIDRDKLVKLLEDILAGVKSGDTLEGNIEFLMADDPEYWDVRGTYRIGNLQGQGGVRMIGSVPSE